MLPAVLGPVLSLFGNLQSILQHHAAPSPQPPPQPLNFRLRHIHGVANERNIIFHDVQPSYDAASIHSVPTKRMKVHRPKSQAGFHRARLRYRRKETELETLDWDEDEIVGPDVTSRETLIELAKMTSNAYVDPTDPQWYNLTEKWNKASIRHDIQFKRSSLN